MIKTYYIRRNGKSKGPYRLGDLKNQNLSAEDQVWTEGLKEWAKAETLPELAPILSGIFSGNHGATTGTSFTAHPAKKAAVPSSNRRNVMLVLTLIAFFIVSGTLLFHSRKTVNPVTHLSSGLSRTAKTSAGSKGKAKAGPLQYLKQETEMRSNLIGDEIIQGTISNSSKTQGFKEIILEVKFLSKTGEVLGKKQFTIEEEVEPGDSEKFRIRTSAPAGAKSIAAAIKGGTPFMAS